MIPRGGALFGATDTFPAGDAREAGSPAPRRSQASFTVSVLTSLPSASNTLATMLLASRRAWAYIAAGGVVIEELVGQYHRAHPQAAVEHAVLGQRLHHVGAETADRAFLDGDAALRAHAPA